MKKKKTRKPFDEEKYYADWQRRKEIRDRKGWEAYLASLSPEELELMEIRERRNKEASIKAEENHQKWIKKELEKERKRYKKDIERKIKKKEFERQMNNIRYTINEGVEWWKDVYDGVMDNILFFLPPKRKER